MVVSSVPACGTVKGWGSFPSHRVTQLCVPAFLDLSRWPLNHVLSCPGKVFMVSLRLLSLLLEDSELAEFSAQWRLQDSLQCCVPLDAKRKVLVHVTSLFFLSQ